MELCRTCGNKEGSPTWSMGDKKYCSYWCMANDTAGRWVVVGIGFVMAFPIVTILLSGIGYFPGMGSVLITFLLIGPFLLLTGLIGYLLRWRSKGSLTS